MIFPSLSESIFSIIRSKSSKFSLLSNIRLNYIHQVTTMIVKTKPSRVVMEDLNIKGMMKNNHLSKAIAEQCLYDFKLKIKYNIIRQQRLASLSQM